MYFCRARRGRVGRHKAFGLPATPRKVLKSPDSHAMKKIVCILAALLPLLALPAGAVFVDNGGREFHISCNGIPCAADTAGRALYCSIAEQEGDSMKLVFTSDTLPYISINYKRHYMGDTVKLVNNFRRTYRLYLGKKQQLWTLHLTPLPIVMIEASAYEHDVYHHGYINIIDPQKRTNGQALFRHFIGARIRGGHTATLAKKPYAIKLWNSKREGKNVSVLGLMKDDNLILDAMYNDKARMRTRLCFDLWNTVDSLPYEVSEGHSRLNGTQGRYVEVFVDGRYNGLYCLTDKINRKKLDLVKTATADDGSTEFHGLLYKATGWSAETRFNDVRDYVNTQNTLAWCEWEQKYPDDNAEQGNWAPLKTLIKFTATETNPDNRKFNTQLSRRYYMQNLANFVLFINLLHINDNNCKNTYISFRDASTGTQRALITPWDLDASFGRNWDGSLLDSQGFGEQTSSCGLFDRLVNHGPAFFRQRFRDTWIRWKHGSLSLDSVRARIIAYKNLLVSSGAWNRETTRWPNSTNSISNEVSYMMAWYSRAVAHTDSVLADFPSAISTATAERSDAEISSADGRICIDPHRQEAAIAIFTADGARIASTTASQPYSSPALAKGIYIVTVKTAAAAAPLRKKILVK